LGCYLKGYDSYAEAVQNMYDLVISLNFSTDIDCPHEICVVYLIPPDKFCNNTLKETTINSFHIPPNASLNTSLFGIMYHKQLMQQN
jgi:hypothetical protein